MAELTTIARPYAEAVFRTAAKTNAIAEYGVALAALGVAVEDPAVASILGNPKVSAAEKADVLSAAAGGKMALPMLNLVAMLIESGKASLFAYIVGHYQRLQREHDGVVKATITSAYALSDAEKASLVEALQKKYGKTVEATVLVDVSLIGGARVQVGDDVVHASVRDTLDKMKQALMA